MPEKQKADLQLSRKWLIESSLSDSQGLQPWLVPKCGPGSLLWVTHVGCS